MRWNQWYRGNHNSVLFLAGSCWLMHCYITDSRNYPNFHYIQCSLFHRKCYVIIPQGIIRIELFVHTWLYWFISLPLRCGMGALPTQKCDTSMSYVDFPNPNSMLNWALVCQKGLLLFSIQKSLSCLAIRYFWLGLATRMFIHNSSSVLSFSCSYFHFPSNNRNLFCFGFYFSIIR